MNESASSVAALILSAFQAYHTTFEEITALAQRRFEERDWRAGHEDARRRLELHDQHRSALVTRLSESLGDALTSRPLWGAIKASFARLNAGQMDGEIAETFFNSVTRAIFSAEVVTEDFQFVVSQPLEHLPSISRAYSRVSRSYQGGELRMLMGKILADFPFGVGYRDLEDDLGRVAERVESDLGEDRLEGIQVVSALFYRNKSAFLLGRLHTASGRELPMALALLHPDGPEGVVLDAVLTDPDQVSVLFSFARASFRVASPSPYQLVEFLKTILPQKPVAELYAQIGYDKHGKTELYRHFMRHLETSPEKFVACRGEKGMVMVCFTLPSYEQVFKLIKDQFGKRTTRTKVRESYRVVYRHDRLGRMVEAQEWENLRLDRRQFSPELLEEVLQVAPSTVEVCGDELVVRHAYTERRVIPLNLYVREAEPEAAQASVVEYGHCIKELSASNIFTGDMFLKNFGVTRHGRVVFYDYDEICLVTDCNFRELPDSEGEDEFEAEAYFYVGPNDVFPEEFARFIDLGQEMLPIFLAHHADLFTLDFWRDRQQRLRAGEWTDVPAYPEERRLRPMVPSLRSRLLSRPRAMTQA